MNQIFEKLCAVFPWVGSRSATETDFHEFADGRFEVVFANEISYGVYVMYGGDHYVFLNSKLRGLLLHYVMFHELAHYLFHAPTQTRCAVEYFDPHVERFRKANERKSHCEAEAAAAWLLIPTLELHEVLQSRDVYESDELRLLVRTRLELWGKYKK